MKDDNKADVNNTWAFCHLFLNTFGCNYVGEFHDNNDLRIQISQLSWLQTEHSVVHSCFYLRFEFADLNVHDVYMICSNDSW